MSRLQRSQPKKSDDHLKQQLGVALSVAAQPLEPQTQARMEARFGHYFGDVLVHSNAPDTLDSRAFAFENHLAFSHGQYAPGTPSGDHLIAHELAHVVQARGRTGHQLRLSDPGEALELQAHRAADRVMHSSSSHVDLSSSAAGVVSRSVWDWIPGMGGFSDSPPQQLQQAPGDGVQAGPFVYGNRQDIGGVPGYNFGYGQGHAQTSTEGSDILVDGDQGKASAGYDNVKIDGHAGAWSSQRPDGTSETNYGVQLGGKTPSVQGSASWGIPGGPGAYVHGDAAGPAFDVSAYGGESGFGVGAQASVGGFNVGGGTTGTDVDEYGKVGLSEGVGAAVRGSWGDTDGDGFREYGGGIDAGPLSVDMRTEDPFRSGVRNFIPGGALLENFIDPGNFTERTANRFDLTTKNATLGTTADVIAGAAGSAYDYAADGVMSAGRGISNAAGAVSDVAGQAWDALPDLPSLPDWGW